MFQTQIEFRRVDTHEYIGLIGKPAFLYIEVSAQQAGHALQGVNIAKNRQGVHRRPGFKALFRHGRPAYALAVALRIVTVYAPYDACCQQVARRLAGHHADTQAHERAMPRVELVRKSTMVWMASRANGRSCCSSRIFSHACSTLRLRLYSSL